MEPAVLAYLDERRLKFWIGSWQSDMSLWPDRNVFRLTPRVDCVIGSMVSESLAQLELHTCNDVLMDYASSYTNRGWAAETDARPIASMT